MSLTQIISYDTPANFVFDASKIEIVGGLAKLKLLELDEDFVETFDSDVGFSYDNAKTEFVGGEVRQLDQRPANATFAANYGASVDGNWGNGSLAGSAVGGAVVAGGKLDLGGFGKYVDYAAAGNASFSQTGAVRFRFTPNYSTKPVGGWNIFFVICDADNDTRNRIEFRQSSSAGQLQFRLNDSTGASLGTFTLANWNLTAGVEYEIEVNFDFTGGTHRVFVDGALFDSFTVTGTRSNAAGLFRIGADYNAADQSDGKYDDVIVFDAVQHTANYTPGYTVPDTAFAGDVIWLPQFSHAGPIGSTIKIFDAFSTVESGSPRYTVSVDSGMQMWWDGTAWVASAGTYAEASTESDIAANISTLPGADGATTIDISIYTTDSNTQASVADLTFETTAQTTYPTDNPTIYPLSTVLADALEDFSAVSSASGTNDVRWTVRDDGVEMWWDGAAWAVSSGYAETNTVAEIATNAAVLDLSGGANLTVTAHLHSGDGTTSPDVTSSTIDYSFFVPEPAGPSLCIVYGWVLDASGAPVVGATVTAKNDPFEHTSRLVPEQSISTQTDSNGYWELEMIETETIAKAIYRFEIDSVLVARGATVPNTVSAEFTTIDKLFGDFVGDV